MPARARTRRPAAVALEAAMVLFVLMLLTLGTMVGGVGVFRHQQVACLAAEAARYASVRGGDYQRDAPRASPTAQQVVDAAVTPKATGMAPADVGVRIEWVDNGAGGGPADWDAAPKDVRSVTAGGEYVSNAVRVTVTYRWAPGVFFGPTTLTAVCQVPVAY